MGHRKKLFLMSSLLPTHLLFFTGLSSSVTDCVNLNKKINKLYFGLAKNIFKNRFPKSLPKRCLNIEELEALWIAVLPPKLGL